MAVDQGKRFPRFDSLPTRPIYSRGSMAGSRRPGGGPPDNPWAGMAEGWKVTSYMVGGLAWAGIGWAIDSLVGTFPILTSIGAVLGEAAAVYLIYLRYGKADD
jgi:hypothetical protein